MARKLAAMAAVIGTSLLSLPASAQQETAAARAASGVQMSARSQMPANAYRLAVPRRGIYHAAFPAFGPAEDTVTRRHIDQFARNISGKDLTWAYFSDNWFDGISFPTGDVNTIRSRGVIPFIRVMTRSTWEACADRKFSLQKIISGRFDRELHRYAQAAARINGPLIMEFGTEMNGDWFPWSGACNGGGTRGGYGSGRLADGPERFRDAYRHLIDIFRQEGAYNVTWVFHINGAGSPAAAWNAPANYYPGDDYIDWLGVSAYGAQTPATIRTWNPSFREVMDQAYRSVASVSPRKPIALLEFGVIENKNKPQWIRDALADLASGRYPRVKAVAWWHSDWQNRDGSWSRMKIDSSKESVAAYRQGIANRNFVTEPVFVRR